MRPRMSGVYTSQGPGENIPCIHSSQTAILGCTTATPPDIQCLIIYYFGI